LSPKQYRQQRGVALITAILIVALASATAIAMVERQQLDIRRTANLLDNDRGYLFSLGAESWVRGILDTDRKDNKIDALAEDWAIELPPLTVEDGSVLGRVEDMQGRFNINNLVDNEGKISALDVARFKRLLQAFDLSPDLADAALDWIDKDADSTFPGGAEDGEYLGNNIPYRTANALMASPSELLLVKGFTYEAYTQLSPYIAALPERTNINLNTAPPPVLQTIAANIATAEAEAIAESRGEEGLNDVQDFLALPALNGRNVDANGLGVSSQYFMLTTHSQFGSSRGILYSLIKRPASGKITVVIRGQGAY